MLKVKLTATESIPVKPGHFDFGRELRLSRIKRTTKIAWVASCMTFNIRSEQFVRRLQPIYE